MLWGEKWFVGHTPSFTCIFYHSLAHSLAQSIIPLHIHQFNQSFTCTLNQFIQSQIIYLFSHSFIHFFFTHPVTSSFLSSLALINNIHLWTPKWLLPHSITPPSKTPTTVMFGVNVDLHLPMRFEKNEECFSFKRLRHGCWCCC